MWFYVIGVLMHFVSQSVLLVKGFPERRKAGGRESLVLFAISSFSVSYTFFGLECASAGSWGGFDLYVGEAELTGWLGRGKRNSLYYLAIEENLLGVCGELCLRELN
jgi:hypothetical protein